MSRSLPTRRGGAPYLAAAIAAQRSTRTTAIAQDHRAQRGQDMLDRFLRALSCHRPRRHEPARRRACRFERSRAVFPTKGLAEALAEGLSVGYPDMPEFVFISRMSGRFWLISVRFKSADTS